MSGLLDGRTAVVTGASRGIGRAIVTALAGAGARVIGVSRTGGAVGPRETVVTCDLTDRDDVARAVDAIRRACDGAPDVLVNSAGAFAAAPVADTTLEAFQELMALNLSAPFQLMRAFLPAMRARGRGHIVSVGSIADHVALPGNAAYAATKFGVRGLHEVLRAELAGTGVRATLISPAAVDTPLWDALDPRTRSTFPPSEAMLPAGDVADAVLFAVTRPERVCIEVIRLSKS
jgi:NAD(P)-dependent dehydrogenase (short-subunit alcohol dehydrogenase family)